MNTSFTTFTVPPSIAQRPSVPMVSCGRCGCTVPTTSMVSMTTTTFTFEGCYTCFTAWIHGLISDSINLQVALSALTQAKVAITRGIASSEVDALCTKIERVFEAWQSRPPHY